MTIFKQSGHSLCRLATNVCFGLIYLFFFGPSPTGCFSFQVLSQLSLCVRPQSHNPGDQSTTPCPPMVTSEMCRVSEGSRWVNLGVRVLHQKPPDD